MTDPDRYHRQVLLAGVGADGQARLRQAHALVVGCGALGTFICDTLARAGVGTLTIVDRDIVELTNLQRQVLFDESDVQQGLPKAAAARTKLARINHEVDVRAHVEDFSPRNAERLADGADIFLDGLDNFEARYLLNDLAVATGRPYLYGGAVGMTGMTMPVLPHPARRRSAPAGLVTWTEAESTPCLRCLFPEAPPPGTTPTCDTVGVLAPVVAIVAAHQVAQAIKLLTNHAEALDRTMLSFDLWLNEERRFDIGAARRNDCPCCSQGELTYLEGSAASATTSLCGRNAVQITPAATGGGTGAIDLADLAARLAPHGSFMHNDFLLRGTLAAETGPDDQPVELTLFPDGRAIIKGTTEPDTARTIYAKYVGA
ncbi:MAG: ThiF family adenylyltransferase [Planctomycetota bacterium]|jgi:adenylyltransferase/sulfurtransferase